MPTYKISELAAKHGLTLRALRFYEQRRLLSPTRDGPHRRVYSENDAMRLAEIVRGTRLGFSIREIRNMLEDGPTGPWLAVTPEAAKGQLGLMRHRLAETKEAVAELEKLARAGSG